MRMKIAKVVLRMCVLLGLAGILAVNALAGGGPVPDPNGLGGNSGLYLAR